MYDLDKTSVSEASNTELIGAKRLKNPNKIEKFFFLLGLGWASIFNKERKWVLVQDQYFIRELHPMPVLKQLVSLCDTPDTCIYTSTSNNYFFRGHQVLVTPVKSKILFLATKALSACFSFSVHKSQFHCNSHIVQYTSLKGSWFCRN